MPAAYHLLVNHVLNFKLQLTKDWLAEGRHEQQGKDDPKEN